jgi:PKD repeat protein
MVLFSQILFCQNETSKWYFGFNAGLDFMTNPPTVLTNGAIHTIEGCATISDPSGNLLFYTDGITVWNSSHTIIPNGTLLGGSQTSTQAALIIKQPGSINLYYVFTIGNSLKYSIIDISLSAGAGSVTVKTVSLQQTCTEKLTATKHCNGIDIWILAHDINSADYSAYLLTSTGLNTVAVVSTLGMAGLGSQIGYLKISPNGRKAASAMYNTNTANFELYDFDNFTGVFSNLVNLVPAGTGAYGCEFSPDGTKLYGALGDGTIYQWNLCAGSPSAIAASVYTVSSGPPQKGAIQIAKDGKIYVSRYNMQTLGAINNPNALGSACGYIDSAQSISTKTCQIGLPNVISSYFKPSLPNFTATTNQTLSCLSATFTSAQVSVCSAVSVSITGVSWIFGDPASGSNNTSTIPSPVHVFSAPGTYTAKELFHNACGADTVKQVIIIPGPVPSLTISPNFTLCPGQNSVALTVSGANTYSWNTGPTSTMIIVSPNVTTNYTVTGTNTVSSCSASKVVNVTVSNCVGIQQQSIENGLSIYPNPTKGEFNVETNSNLQLEVFNQLGEKISEYKLEKGTHLVNLSGSAGIYFIKATAKSGIVTYKIVKIE